MIGFDLREPTVSAIACAGVILFAYLAAEKIAGSVGFYSRLRKKVELSEKLSAIATHECDKEAVEKLNDRIFVDLEAHLSEERRLRSLSLAASLIGDPLFAAILAFTIVWAYPVVSGAADPAIMLATAAFAIAVAIAVKALRKRVDAHAEEGLSEEDDDEIEP